DHLADRGVARSDTDRVHAPAGLDLGAVANAEIAVAVMADLVARRARGELVAAGSGPTPLRAEATDPVCGMTVLVDDAKYHTVHDGADYWFCAPGCLRAFRADPQAFLAST
ncbi:MAG: YHS domain-containing protein, partial [Acidimicrobiaceae bacterium]|nr:YHS domain-containing protein [Acidimicrobiaceae bacterium]